MTVTALHSYNLADLLDAIAAKTPTPGGGAVASAVGALAGALGRMVVSYSLGKKSLAEHRGELERAAAALDEARHLLVRLADEDAAAYGRLSELMKLPADDPRRGAEWGEAVSHAIAAPRSALGTCRDLIGLLETLAPITNKNLRSDLAIAAILTEAAARAAAWNVAVNLPMLDDPSRRGRIEAECERELSEINVLRGRVERACRA